MIKNVDIWVCFLAKEVAPCAGGGTAPAAVGSVASEEDRRDSFGIFQLTRRNSVHPSPLSEGKSADGSLIPPTVFLGSERSSSTLLQPGK